MTNTAETIADTLYEWFGNSARAHPDAVALEVDGVAWTYRRLANVAGNIASRILAVCDGQEPRRVGLLASRTATAYAGYLAVLRLGATVVPLGTSFPAERNAAVAAAARLDVVLADGSADSTALGDRTLVLDHARLAAWADESVPSIRAFEPRGAAYILFTSGSTGVPKGVPISHGNVCAFLRNTVARYGAGPGARVSQIFDLTFDPSVFDMFAAWGSGATLVVPARADLLAPVRFVNRHAITHWNSVPSVISLAHRLRMLRPDAMPTLRRSVFCGEPLTLDQAKAWRIAAPHSRVENAYGPTELTVTCTSYTLPQELRDWPRTHNGTVPIGTPYPGVEYRMIDGELCVRGPQRFDGYLDPADDHGRFRTGDGHPYDPNTPLDHTHWYRTGDRISTTPDSADPPVLVHLGRNDEQVQVQGYRVELAEIAAAIREIPEIADAAVVPLTRPGGDTTLAAAFTCTDPHRDDATTETLRQHLQRRLPDYMIPRNFLRLDALPLNPRGKIDRPALAQLLTDADPKTTPKSERGTAIQDPASRLV